MQTATTSTERRKRIAMVHPKFPPSFWSFGFIKDIGDFQAVMPPLGLATLAALTPDEYDVFIVDENIEEIDFDLNADLVVLSAMAIQEQRLFEVADEFRRRGYTVCMGGPICNVLPERCRPHCDILFEGEGEYTWKQFLSEWERDEHSNHYQQIDKVDLADTPPPRVDLLKTGAYRVGCIQTTRGCPFNCEFCDIIVTYGRKVRCKPIEKVIRELQVWADAGVDFVTITDDNLVGDRVYAKKMLKAVGDWNRARRSPLSYYVEASIDCVRDVELLELMRYANVTEIFLGIESPRSDSLKETKKFQNAATPLVEAVKTIQSYGFVTVAGMIIGFDNDDEGIFEDQERFLQEAGIPIVMLGILQAIPRTPLYERLEKAGRLRSAAQGNNTLSFTNVEPLKMSYGQLISGYRALFERIYTWDKIGERWLANVQQWGRKRLTFDGFGPLSKKASVGVNGEKFKWWQKPLGRPKPQLLRAALMILRYYFCGGKDKRDFALRMFWGTLKRAPTAILQSLGYLAYFIHLREYTDKVVAQEAKFDYALNEVNTTSNQFGEGGSINMVKLEGSQKINLKGAEGSLAIPGSVSCGRVK